MGKIRLRTSLGKIDEMRVKMNKINKSNRNENSISNFLISRFSPVMANLSAGSSAGESATLTLDNRESLKSKLLRASSDKISCLQETVSLLNQSLGEENQALLEADKEPKILGKGLQKAVERK